MPQPNKIPLAFAASGDKNIIPESTETTGLASWREGFPAITSAPFSEGGIAPKRADFNGIFNALSQAVMWMQQGGVYSYDADTDYEAGNVVLDSGGLYVANAANGPSSVVVQPSSDTTGATWKLVRLDLATQAAAGYMSGADKTKLDGLISTDATPTAAGYMSAADKTRLDSVILTDATPTAAGYMSAEDKNKLDGLISTDATQSAAGYMSAADKIKLDGLISTNATQSAAGYMSAEDKKNLEALLADKTWYKRPSLMTPNKTTVTIPAGMQVAINGGLYITNTATTLNLDSFITAANRKGKDVYVYACVPSSGTAPTFVLSLNSTVPTGYTAAMSRKIGGFHCLCADVGTISGHTLSGYVAGDILPLSVWDLLFRAESENSGMVFVNGTWYDIYLPSWESNKLQSVYGGTIVDGTSAMPMHGERFAEYAGLVSKRLIDRDEFLVIAKGSNERTNIANSADPGTTGGHKDTAGRRMISNYGLEDCCGALWQWTRDTWGAFNVLSTSYSNQGGINATAQTSEAAGGHYLNDYDWQADGRGTSNIDIDGSASLYGNAHGALVRALVGGIWAYGSHCGSRSVFLSNLSSNRHGANSGRLASEPRVVNL